MKFSFKTKLMMIMGIFSIILTLVTSLVHKQSWERNLLARYEIESVLIEDIIVTAVSDADKAFRILDKNLEPKMRSYSEMLAAKYRENPDLASWDYAALKQQFDGMDVYIIDETLTVLYSSYPNDIGLSFRKEGKPLSEYAQILTDRMQGDKFVADGIDHEVNSGIIRKYSYMPTHDHKYLLELGVKLEDNPIIESFNFLEIYQNLIEKYNYVNDVTVYATSGKAIGKSGADGKSLLFAEENRPYFELAYTEQVVQEVERTLHGEPVSYRYVPYNVDFDSDVEMHTNRRIIEIVFNDNELRAELRQINRIVLVQFLATITLALLSAYAITRLIAKPMYLASHDLLTGLNNRAVFEHSLMTSIEKNRKKARKTALLHVDLDNFKQVNDKLGHDAGDHLLKETGRRIRSAVHTPGDTIARIGGDEFVVILNDVRDEEAAVQVAVQIIAELQRPLEVQGVDVVQNCEMTASIGIAIAPDHAEDSEHLYRCADLALYQAKWSGKNTVCVYSDRIRRIEKVDTIPE